MSEDKDGADIEDVLSSIRRLVAKTAPAQTVSSAERRGALRAEPRLRPTRPVGDAVEQKLVLSPSQRVSKPENPWTVIPLDPADHASGDGRAWAREDRLADYADGGASPSAAPQDALGAALAAAAEGLRGPVASPAGAVQQDPSPQAAIPPATDPLPDQADSAQYDAPERHHNFISTEIADEDGYDEEVETLTLFAAPPPPLRAKPKAEAPLSTRLSPSQRCKKMILQRRILLMTWPCPTYVVRCKRGRSHLGRARRSCVTRPCCACCPRGIAGRFGTTDYQQSAQIGAPRNSYDPRG